MYLSDNRGFGRKGPVAICAADEHMDRTPQHKSSLHVELIVDILWIQKQQGPADDN